jgi:hypothetical protein
MKPACETLLCGALFVTVLWKNKQTKRRPLLRQAHGVCKIPVYRTQEYSVAGVVEFM